MCIHTSLPSYIHTCMHSYIHACIHTYMSTNENVSCSLAHSPGSVMHSAFGFREALMVPSKPKARALELKRLSCMFRVCASTFWRVSLKQSLKFTAPERHLESRKRQEQPTRPYKLPYHAQSRACCMAGSPDASRKTGRQTPHE